MWADIDTKEDYLNYLETAEVVVEIVRDSSMRPVSVGIYGTWGTGKSTLLNLIEAQLKAGGEDFILIRFDAWLYQGYDDSRAALMEVIAKHLFAAAKDNEGLTAKAIGFLGRVNKLRTLGMLVDAGAAVFGLPTFGAGGRAAVAMEHYFEGDVAASDDTGLKEGARAAQTLIRPKKPDTPPEEIDAFRREFGELLDGLGKTVIVFVDNLDRCLPTQTIHTLEALRLFLFMRQTAFVVAADEDMVRHAVSQHFKDASKNHVTDYLDKLIQIPVRVPRLGITEVRAYLFMLLASAGNAKSVDVEALRRRLEENLRLSWSQQPVTADQAVKLLGASAVDFSILWPKFQQSMATRPQKTVVGSLGLGI
jgi:predicted KAP-like P-loop ATPase